LAPQALPLDDPAHTTAAAVIITVNVKLPLFQYTVPFNRNKLNTFLIPVLEKMNGQLHALAALFPEKVLVPTG
jgi:hypothetical protein